jgi:hypothetical protein
MAIPWAILGQLALQAGQSYLGSKAQQAEQRAMNRARERQRVAQEKENNRVNLMNAFGGNVSAAQIPVTYKGSDRANTLRSLGQVAGLGSQAIGLYSGMKEAETARKAAEETRRLQNTAAQMTIDRQLGETAGQAAPLPTDRMLGKGVSPLPPQGMDLLRRVGQAGVQYPESVTSDYGRNVFDATIRQRQASLLEQAQQNELFQLQKDLAELKLLNIQTPTKKGLSLDKKIDMASNSGGALAVGSPNLTREEVIISPDFIQTTGGDPQLAQAYLNGYQQEQGVQLKQLRTEKRDILDSFETLVKNEPMVKIRNDVSRGLDEVVQSSKIGGGFADIAMLKALAKLQDPGSVVRTEEYETLTQAIAVYDKAGIKLSQFFDGTRLNDRGRQTIIELAFASYNARMKEIDGFINNAISGRVSDFTTRNDLEKRSNPFKLPAIDIRLGEDTIKELRSSYDGIRLDLNEIQAIGQTYNDADVLKNVNQALGLKPQINYRQPINTGQAGAGGLLYRPN